MIFHSAVRPPVITEAENRQKVILDAVYSKVDVNETVDQLDNINDDIPQKC
jgi:hypothetical protein